MGINKFIFISNMRSILTEEFLAIPEGVTISVKARKVIVTGPRGRIEKNLAHMPMDIRVMKMATKKQKGLHVRLHMWNGKYAHQCSVNTFKSQINNMILGVTIGFLYKMRLVHAHFPINANISKDKTQIEVKNFLGGKKGHLVKLPPGATVELSKATQNELIFQGNDLAAMSQACAKVSQVCQIGRKDERKFLDGIFVSEKTNVIVEE